MNKYQLITTSTFKKEYKKMVKRNYNISLLEKIVDQLLKGEKLPEKNKDHALSGN